MVSSLIPVPILSGLRGVPKIIRTNPLNTMPYLSLYEFMFWINPNNAGVVKNLFFDTLIYL
jgi:hypothetical protein